MMDVAETVFSNTDYSQTVSAVMRCYGFSGRNGNHFAGLNLQFDNFVEFVNMYPGGCPDDWPNHCTIDEFMRVASDRNNNPDAPPRETYRTSEPASVSSSFEPGPLIKFIAGVVAIVLVFIVFKAAVGFIGSATGLTYYLEKFNYDGCTVVGNKAVTAPKGMGMMFLDLADNEFKVGDLQKSKINGYSLVYDGHGVATVGYFKRSKPKGWCIIENSNENIVTLAKLNSNGKKKGYGIVFQKGTSTLEKYGLFGTKTIATNSGNGWFDSKGREIELKGKYGKIYCDSNTEYHIDDLKISVEADNSYGYEVGDFKLFGNVSDFYYENKIKGSLVFTCLYWRNNSLHIEEVDRSNNDVLGVFDAKPNTQ